MNLVTEIQAAEKRIACLIRVTPLEESLPMSTETGCHIYLKLENLQITGSFKARGAFNKLLSLSPEQQARGIVAASTGNHGIAVAYGLNKLGLKGKIFTPERASPTKLEAIASYNIPIERHGTDCVMAQTAAKAYVAKNNMPYISPCNDMQVIAGQGVIGIELMQQLDKMDAVFIPIGGGGLIAGLGAFLKNVSPATKVIGCLPANAPIMAESIKAGRIVNLQVLPSIAEATAGGVEPGSITFELCQQFVDDYILVSEDEIIAAMRFFMNAHHMMIEGASGVTLAAIRKAKAQFQGQNVVGILSGANISLETLKSVIG